ncbi:MAG: V-type ATPase subunit [Gammaproteobacteria bacterium]|nr:V-type ATPase subunit [Gammaproteobacteria bacterium]
MSRLAEQAYLRTRLAIMRENLIEADRLAELAAMPYDELATESGFDEFDGSGSPGQRLAAFERAQLQSWLDELSALLRPLEGSGRRLLTQWASRYELLNIKALVRGKIGQLPNDEIERSLYLLPGFLNLNIEELLNTDNVRDLLRQLQNTRYRRIATQALRRYEENPDPFLLDATLDQQFYGELIDRAGQLDSGDRNEILDLIGRIVDRHNLVWSLRYRFNYFLQPSEVLYLAIDGGRVLNRTRLQRVVNEESLAEACAQLPAHLLPDDADTSSITQLDVALKHDIERYAMRVLRVSPSVLTSALAYLVLRHGDIMSLYAIVHARVHGLADEVLLASLDQLHGVHG